MPCNGICYRYKVTKPPMPNTRYGVGQKRCTACDIFTDWDGRRCPCCSGMLRTKPKGTARRRELMIVNKIKRM
ncbi:hypothetical protein [Nitrosopumilus sp.]|uniref:hypothetical protein n=1 Tax=Nitrosopumilus sp. TaxID=2024843 RepID=UPI00292DBD1D|nr:hypothetical protein [Nitrosopumilus sp.]